MHDAASSVREHAAAGRLRSNEHGRDARERREPVGECALYGGLRRDIGWRDGQRRDQQPERTDLAFERREAACYGLWLREVQPAYAAFAPEGPALVEDRVRDV